MKKRLLVIPLLLAVTGCGSDVDKVKNGIMQFNKTIPLGQALDNWDNCESRDWESFDASNGVRVVQFTCHNSVSFFKAAKDLLSKEGQSQTSSLDITSLVQTFQFTMNQDNTFQVDNLQVATTWEDGKVYEDSQPPLEELASAYKNEAPFDVSMLDESTALMISQAFSIVRMQAK